MASPRNLDERSDTRLQDSMHHCENTIPIHSRKVDILKLDRWTWGAISPADMSTDKALDILRSRQLALQEGTYDNTPQAISLFASL
jgi:hypothetical protein